MIFEGALATKSAISSKKRHIEAIYIAKDKKSRDVDYILKIAAKAPFEPEASAMTDGPCPSVASFTF